METQKVFHIPEVINYDKPLVLGRHSVALVKRILRKCERNENEMRNMTGLHEFLEQNRDEQEVSSNNIVFEISEINEEAIRNEILKHMLSRHSFLTTSDIFVHLHRNSVLPKYIDLSTFRKLLVKLGYVWKLIKTPETTDSLGYFVVVENPNFINERCCFLQKYLDHCEKRNVYCIDEYKFGSAKTIYAATSHNGIVAMTTVERFDQQTLFKWITTELTPHLQGPSLIILSGEEHHFEAVATPPTPYSLNSEIIEWLQFFDVPCSEEMPKAKLMTLVDTYTDVTEIKYKIDEFLKIFGHVVLRKPKSISFSPVNLKINSAGCTIRDMVSHSHNVEENTSDSARINEIFFYYKMKVDNAYYVSLQLDEHLDKLYENSRHNIGPVPQDLDSDLPSSEEEE